METANSTTPWTVTDITPAQPAATPEPAPERLTARQDLVRVLNGWAGRNGLPFDGAVVGTDDDEDLTVTLPGLTLEDDDIVPNEREYGYTATILVEVTVRGSVTARDEDAATEEAEYQSESAELDVDAYGLRVDGWDIQSVSVDEVEEE